MARSIAAIGASAASPVLVFATIALWALHVEMVKQAQAHRAELLNTVLSLFSLRVGK